MAAAAGKKESVSLSLFMEVNNFGSMATLARAERVWMRRWAREQKEAWRTQIFEVGPAGAVICEPRDLGIQWPQWHTFAV